MELRQNFNDNPEYKKKYSLLDEIEYPSQLRKLDKSQLPQLCQEIREYIIENLSHNPGHFASSMGAVEITVALHYVFNTPEDHLVWDVGHQAYAHKILTGRRKEFCNLRKINGLSGFPNPSESVYDTFMAGHASNSISAALGMAIADRLNPENENKHTVAIIGDASISGGLAFEGLNNASIHKNNLLIILNDNDMSIDNNVGALHHYLSNITTSKGYNKWRYKIYNFLKRKNIMTENKRGALLRFNNSLKALISRQQNIFEGLNIRYFGPFDGHDVGKIVQVLEDIKDMQGPRLLHLRTVKGKGFAQAEADPATWHAPGKFDIETGKRLKNNNDKDPLRWQQVFGHTLVELAESNENIVGITAAMPSGTSVNLMAEKYPERTFDVGISEGHAVTFAGGLATQGKKPFCAIYSSFFQRAYDNLIHDVAIQSLPITFCLDRAGIVGEDGVTHHGLFDLAYLRVIPGIIISSPMDEESLRNLMFTSVTTKAPFVIRYPRGKAVNTNWRTPMKNIPIGKGRMIFDLPEKKVAVLTIGPIGNDVKNIINELQLENISITHYDMVFLKPIDNTILKTVAEKFEKIVTIEDGTINGGLGSAVTEWINDNGYKKTIIRIGVNDEWIHQGTVNQLRKECGYDYDSIRDKLKSIYKEV